MSNFVLTAETRTKKCTMAGGAVIPPLNFAMVSPGVYRSGYPNVDNHSFLKTLRLKTLIYLCPEDCNAQNLDFYRQSNIEIMQFGIQGNKEPFVDIPEEVRSFAEKSFPCRIEK